MLLFAVSHFQCLRAHKSLYETLAGDTLIAAYESISDMLETILPGLKLSKITPRKY